MRVGIILIVKRWWWRWGHGSTLTQRDQWKWWRRWWWDRRVSRTCASGGNCRWRKWWRWWWWRQKTILYAWMNQRRRRWWWQRGQIHRRLAESQSHVESGCIIRSERRLLKVGRLARWTQWWRFRSRTIQPQGVQVEHLVADILELINRQVSAKQIPPVTLARLAALPVLRVVDVFGNFECQEDHGNRDYLLIPTETQGGGQTAKT